nr:MAG TPA_asm: hypothetical protein [Caudoviricetes sp.]
MNLIAPLVLFYVSSNWHKRNTHNLSNFFIS